MRSKKLGIASILVMACIAIGLPSAAQDTGVNVDYEAAYVSKYVWRGTVVNPDPAFQPSLTMSWGSGMSLNLWGSMDTTGINGTGGKFTEIDYTLNYDFKAAGREWSAGVILYDFPNTDAASTKELYTSVALGGKYNTGLALYWDIDEADGLYLSLGAGTSTPIGANSLEIGAALGLASSGYNDAYFGVSKSSLVDASLRFDLPISTNGKWEVTPSLTYSRLLDSRLRNAVDDPDNWVLGVTAAASF